MYIREQNYNVLYTHSQLATGEAEQGAGRAIALPKIIQHVQLVKIYMSILPYYVLLYLYKVCPLNGRVPEPPLRYTVNYHLHQHPAGVPTACNIGCCSIILCMVSLIRTFYRLYCVRCLNVLLEQKLVFLLDNAALSVVI